MNPFLRDLVNVSQHFPAAIADCDVMSVVVEESDFI